MNRNYTGREPQVSEREIRRRYQQLEIKPADPNRVNCYECPACKGITKTIDRHYGTTPMFMKCKKCGQGTSKSSWYHDIAPDIEPTHEWVIPSLDQTLKYKREPGMLEHIFRGGLDLQEIKKPFVSREEGAKLRQERRSNEL